MRDQGDLLSVLIVLVTCFVILSTGTYALSAVAEIGDSGPNDGDSVSSAPLLDGLDTVHLRDDIGTDETVVNSRGHAVALTGGNDSYLESTEGVNVSNGGEWTVTTWARVNASNASEDMAVFAVDGELLITYNGSVSEWRAWYYDADTGNSHEIAVDAPNQPGNLTQIMVIRNDTELTIYRNATPGETVAVSSSATVDAPLNASNFNGSLDESRGFSEALNSSQRNESVTAPVEPVTSDNRTFRIMFDRPSADSQRLYFAPGKITTSNVGFVDGLPGDEMQGKNLINDITGTTDYIWKTDGPSIKPVDGGELDGAPVAFVDYELGGLEMSLVGTWTTVISLAAVLFLLAPLGVIILHLQRGGRR